MSLELTVESFKRSVAQIGRTLGPEADWAPVLILECEGDERLVVPIGSLFHESFGARGKDLLATAIPVMVKRYRAWAVALVTTAWVISGDQEELGRTLDSEEWIPPAEHPDRTEIVSLMVKTAEQAQFHSAEIVRRPGRPPALRPWEVMAGQGFGLGGRFGDALEAAWKEEA